jgi:beta-lactam-binding protein with PASTA domain/tRNA A-37 threonylcarbamoyl transferase component Bud32
MAELSQNSVIDGRYRILEHVGSGGMADVYHAEDTHLGRPVALKLLYRRFAQDHEFVERFRREASAAAALQHPNVVSVYDRGEFDGTYYIAMEFCEGSSLKAIITREAPLDCGRAIELAKKILLAARFAHRRGVIHRDLKPHNVIVERDEGGDNVKVADFGIARAGASEITEVGAIMGTAQYLSPEQAQGRSVNEASDLYSVGVVLFEMLTGRPPFEGDSAVAIALKHVNQPAPSPREFRPEIPPELEAVVLRALAKNAADRYPDADSFLRDLESASAALAAPTSNGGSTAEFEPAGIAAPADPVRPTSAELPPTEAVAERAVEAEPAPAPGAEVEPEPPGRRRRLALALLVLLGLGAALLVAFLVLRPNQVEVPIVVGKPLESARQELDAAGFQVDIDRRADPAPRDTVFRQVPSGGEVDEGSTVTLFVSNGPSTAKVPDVLGLSEQDARERLKRARFRSSIEREGSTKVPEGTVIRSDPGPGTAIERDSKVTLFISTGPREVTVPDVVGQDQEDAASRLSKDGLNVVVRERASGEPVDTVVAQTPSAGQQVDEGSSVTLFVSNGRLDEVPDVVGLEQGEAEAEIRDAGFGVSVRTRSVDEPDGDGRVLSQTPSGGKQRRRGDTVVITIGEFTPPEAPPEQMGESG